MEQVGDNRAGWLAGMSLTHPEFRKPSCDTVLVRGAPGSGKTTYCNSIATAADVVIDLDECFTEVCGVHGHRASPEHFTAAVLLRNKKINALSRKKHGVAYIIVCSPTDAETEWWKASLGCSVVTMDASLADIEARRIGLERKHLAARWFAEAKSGDWQAPKAKVAVGLDGWPV